MLRILPEVRFARQGAPAQVCEDIWGREVRRPLGPAAPLVALHHTPSVSVDRRAPRRLLGFPEIVSALLGPHNPDDTASPNSDMPAGWHAGLLRESLLKRYSNPCLPCTGTCVTWPLFPYQDWRLAARKVSLLSAIGCDDTITSQRSGSIWALPSRLWVSGPSGRRS